MENNKGLLSININFEGLEKIKNISTGKKFHIKCTCTNKTKINVKILEA